MDVEEYARRELARGTAVDAIVAGLADELLQFKAVDRDYAEAFSRAVVEEVMNTRALSGPLFTCPESDVRMGEFGVGSRGTGDFFAHRQIARIIGKTSAAVGVDEMDDAGAVAAGEGRYVVCTVDGMHSRLSEFPYLAGFHVTRATLRDLYVMGARPLMLFSDIHVADDGDVGKIFDYTAGITTVGETMGVPLVTGSTLRIGGDMVLGTRMTGCVGAVGAASHLTARRLLAPGDVLLMTEGAGGGTIATAAIYSGFSDVVEETINLHFLIACEALLESDVLPGIHAMTDVTNGGLRGDAFELAETAGCRVVIREEQVGKLVNGKVARMLDDLDIDYLGVSIDSLLIAAPRSAAEGIAKVVESAGVAVSEVGYAEEGSPKAVLVSEGKETDFSPRFRESAYTPVKKVVDLRTGDIGEMERRVVWAADEAIRKKEDMVRRLRTKHRM